MAVARRRCRARAGARRVDGGRAVVVVAGPRSSARRRQRARAGRLSPPGVEVLRGDRDQETVVTFANPLPPWALAAIAAGLLLVAWLAYRTVPIAPRRRYALSALRLI